MRALGAASISSYLRALLGVASVLFWIVTGLLIAATCAYVGALISIERGWLDESVLRSDIGGGGIKISMGDGQGDGQGDGERALDPFDWYKIIPTLLAGVIALFAILFIVRRLKAMFDTFVANDPFRAENGDHLRGVWIALVVIQLTKLFEYYGAVFLAALFRAGGLREYSVSFSVDDGHLTTWFVIGILVVLAEVFREGARMREERDLTV